MSPSGCVRFSSASTLARCLTTLCACLRLVLRYMHEVLREFDGFFPGFRARERHPDLLDLDQPHALFQNSCKGRWIRVRFDQRANDCLHGEDADGVEFFQFHGCPFQEMV